MKHRGVLLAAALMIALVSASPAAAQTGACPDANTPSVVLSNNAVEQSVLCLINGHRAANGAQPVSAQATLRQAALGHSQEMVSMGYFAHDSPTGSTPMSRIIASGYPNGFARWQFGENLGWGSGLQSTPQMVVNAWMASPPHQHNLLLPDFKEIGVAAVKGTPVWKLDLLGVTITTEYGWRNNNNTSSRNGKRKCSKKRRGSKKGKRCRKRR